jgi:hypothetical protein
MLRRLELEDVDTTIFESGAPLDTLALGPTTRSGEPRATIFSRETGHRQLEKPASMRKSPVFVPSLHAMILAEKEAF